MTIYKLWQAGGASEAWYQLSPPEQQVLLGRVAEALKTVGGKELIVCDASWCNGEWPLFGVEKFPDIAAVQRHEAILAKLNWDRYVHSRSTLGTKWAPPIETER
jgi:hypothetical protein